MKTFSKNSWNTFNPVQFKSCTRKNAFESERIALKYHPGFRVYKCDFCKKYHITSKGTQ